MSQNKNNGALVAIIAMMFLFAMISFVTNMAAPFGTIWKFQYEWAGMLGNMMNFAAYLFFGIPAGMMITKMGYKKTALVALALGFVGVGVQYVSSTTGAETPVLGGLMNLNYFIYLVGAFICGICVCILNTVVNPMLNLLGGGGNRGNQLIQTGGSLNSLAATLTPMLAGAMIGEVTKDTSMANVAPLLMIALAIFAASFVIILFTKIVEPATEATDVVAGIKGALGYRHLVLGIVAIFFYVGIEVGIPGEMIFYLGEPGGVLGSVAAGSAIAGIYWLLMLVGRFSSSLISGKVSTRAQIITVSSVGILLVLAAIFLPEDMKMNLKGYDVPVKCLFLVLCGLCTSVMWGGIFNLATEGLGKYTASASGLFMTMVVGGGVMPMVQESLAGKIGYVQSYWVVVAMLAYILFYGVIGSKPAKK